MCLLSPQTTMSLDDLVVSSIAAEPDSAQQERARLLQKRHSLKIAHVTLSTLAPTMGKPSACLTCVVLC